MCVQSHYTKVSKSQNSETQNIIKLLLLNEAKLNTFKYLHSSGNYTEPNLPYQSWLVLNRGLELVVEQGVIEEVLVSHTPNKVKKSLKKGGPRQPDSPSRYVN